MSVEFIDNSDKFLEEIKIKKKIVLEMIGLTAEKYAKEICPVGTPESTGIPGYIGGRLRNSITHKQIDEDTEAIGSAVEYAPFVELGTVKMKSQPYLKPAVLNHMKEYQNITADIMEE
ncbi:MAG: hypothetical protein RRY22_04140 [Bacilli bacterium]